MFCKCLIDEIIEKYVIVLKVLGVKLKIYLSQNPTSGDSLQELLDVFFNLSVAGLGIIVRDNLTFPVDQVLLPVILDWATVVLQPFEQRIGP